ncbi:hypothetical protein AGMMS49942_29430 [Spirochaetia bacterium]|nr:hypothetical protein AGMMS49942_29430 [Spirochaetia bacterium]
MGYTPAASLLAVKALFDANVSKVYHDGSADTDVTVLSIPKGKTLLFPVSVTLGGSGAGIKVEDGGTLLISGTLTPDTGDVVVESGGTLTVQSGGNLVANSTKDLQVKSGAIVTIKSGGTLTSTSVLNDAATASDSIIAQKIGGLTKTASGANLLGTITFESGAWLAVPAADIVTATERGWKAHNRLSTPTQNATGAVWPSGTGYVLKVTAGNNTALIQAIGSVPAGNELVIANTGNVPAATFTVLGKITVTATGGLTTGSGMELIVKGSVVAGNIVITGDGASGTGVTTTYAAGISLTGSTSTLSIGIGDGITIPAGASIVVGGVNGISLGEGVYESTAGGAAVTIAGITGGGATLTMSGTAGVFKVGNASSAKGNLTIGNKSVVVFGDSNAVLLSSATTAGFGKVWFKAGAKVGTDNAKGIDEATGKLKTAGNDTFPRSANLATAYTAAGTGILAADLKLQSKGGGGWELQP